MSVGALIQAIEGSDLEAVRELLKQDPSLAVARGDGGEQPILLAAYQGAEDILILLAQCDKLDLVEASVVGDLARVTQLLASNPEQLGQRSYDGWTAVHLAAFFDRKDVAEALLDAGASTDLVSENAMANQPLHAALAGQGGESLVSLLVGRGADVNARAAGGVTPLHLAASRGNDAVAKLLLRHGADRHARLEDGQTAAEIAAARNHPRLAGQLR